MEENADSSGSSAPDPSPPGPVSQDRPVDTSRPGWLHKIAPTVGIWQLLVFVAMVMVFALAWAKLPGPSRTEVIAPPPNSDLQLGYPDGNIDFQQELALKAIDAYLQKRGKTNRSPVDYTELLKNVIEPLVSRGILAAGVGEAVAKKVLGKGGWFENVAQYGGELLKDYLDHKWDKACKAGDNPAPAPPVFPANYPTTMTCSPVVTLTQPPQVRYIYRLPPRPQKDPRPCCKCGSEKAKSCRREREPIKGS